MKKLMLAVLMIGFMSSHLSAQSQDMEFTPGPRMIRAIEEIAGYYAHLSHSLGLTTEQKEAMAGLVQRIKTAMWMKEAVLVGMFQELEEKRRHGLLQDNEYRIANTLTGGIETDELNLFIDTLANLRGVLTADQQAKVRASSHPAMAFRISQGFNTKIGLMSLEGIGRGYNGYRDELRLTDAQAQSIHSLLEAARREVLRLGTEIDLSRVEADELVTRPEMDPEVIRAKMQKTGETEGVLFNKLFAVSDQIDAQLTEEQRKKLAELKQNRQRHAADKERSGHAGAGHGNRPGPLGFDYFLDQTGRLGLTPEQVSTLVAAKNETRKTVLIEQAKLKGAELQLLNLLRHQNGETPAPEDKIATAVQGLEQFRSRITQVKALGYLKARQILTREQQQRVHPPQTLEDGR
ncbi:MAG: Spy/CpxP family protein refolding chaperone [Nitrospiraceae bacterium]